MRGFRRTMQALHEELVETWGYLLLLGAALVLGALIYILVRGG
jgi:hypothetical protein